MRAAVVVTLLLTFLVTCPDTYAADESNEPDLLIVFDHAKLTQWVLEEFPDGLPFDRTGVPTDAEQAQKFWELIAGWPISINGPVHGLLDALEAISQETGLPILFGRDAWDRLKDADAKMKMFTVSDSVEKTVRIICRTAAVDKTAVTPGGLVVLGPDDPDAPEQLLAPPPKNAFRWRADYHKLVEKALGEDWDPETATDDDWRKRMEIATSIRCDLVIVEPVTPGDFLNWVAAASKQTIAIDVIDPGFTDDGTAKSDPRFLGPPVRDGDDEKMLAKVGPVVCYFTPFLDAVNMALDGTGIELVAAETCFRVLPAKPKNTFRWRDDYWAWIHKELGEGWDPVGATEKEVFRAVQIAAEARCDLIIAEPMKFAEFVDWLALASEWNIGLESSVLERIDAPPEGQEVIRIPEGSGGFVEGVKEIVKPYPDVLPIELRNVKSLEAVSQALYPLGLKAVAGALGFFITPANTFTWRESWGEKLEEGAFSGGTLGEGTPEEWVHLWDVILDTRYDLVVAEETELGEFLEWFCSETQLNVSFHTAAFASRKLYAKPNADRAASADFPSGDPDTEDLSRDERIRMGSVQPASFRNITVRKALNALLAEFDLMVMAGSIGQIRIVPKGLTKEELEQLRQEDVESERSDTGSSHQEEGSHD